MIHGAFFFLLSLCLGLTSYAQYKNAGEYVNAVKLQHKEISLEVIRFTEEVEIGMQTRALDGHRRAIVQKLKMAQTALKKFPAFPSDRSLQDSLASFEQRVQAILEKEYPLIIRWQDSVAKSPMLLKKFGASKQAALLSLIKEESIFFETLKKYSVKNGVAVSKKQDDEYEELVQIQKVGKQHNTFQYIYLKCTGQESVLVRTIEFRKRIEMEQSAATLLKYIKEGNSILDTLKADNTNKSLVEETRKLLEFYTQECEYKVPMLISFMGRGGEDQRKGKTDIGSNIKANPHVNIEGQDNVATYSNTKGDLDAERPIVQGNWSKASQAFLKKHLPAL